MELTDVARARCRDSTPARLGAVAVERVDRPGLRGLADAINEATTVVILTSVHWSD